MLHPEYVRGFIDAEGCFYYNRRARYNHVSFRLYNKNANILEQLTEFFGCGHIYHNNHGTNKDVSELVMQSKAELKVLLKFVDEYPPIVKQTNRPRNVHAVTTFKEWCDVTKKYLE